MKQMSHKGTVKTPTVDLLRETGRWDSSLDKLYEWDAGWTEAAMRMSDNPWTNGVLPLKTIELICVALNAACTNMDERGTRRHIRAALEAGATREEILEVLKCASAMAIHSCSLGAPILLEEAKAAGVEPAKRSESAPATPACDQMRAIGQWNQAWDPFYELDPVWTDQFFAVGTGIYQGGVLSPKDVELLSIALDASYTHMYAPGTRRHIKAALKLGASMEEIMEVLKLCVASGMNACSMGVPILAEELEGSERRR
jgi:alkylhydroperoxidase/carboxymuconolactone decarboxylase family protein YurZ